MWWRADGNPAAVLVSSAPIATRGTILAGALTFTTLPSARNWSINSAGQKMEAMGRLAGGWRTTSTTC